MEPTRDLADTEEWEDRHVSFRHRLTYAIPSFLVFLVVYPLVDNVLFPHDPGPRALGELAAAAVGTATGVGIHRATMAGQ